MREVRLFNLQRGNLIIRAERGGKGGAATVTSIRVCRIGLGKREKNKSATCCGGRRRTEKGGDRALMLLMRKSPERQQPSGR